MEQVFITGVNYWPGRKAMYWWRDFERREIEEDFRVIAGLGLRVVRIFLTWEDFQPAPHHISSQALDELKTVADIAQQEKVLLMPTFFCGHMSGVNWLPPWMLKPAATSMRFPVFSTGSYRAAAIRNFYIETELAQSQLLQIERVCQALKGHPAIHSYDLGNEASNCCLPPHRDSARQWLNRMCSGIKKHSGGIPVTLGMHAEDLEEDRRLWPQDAALYCDFLSMHGYPFYLDWVRDYGDVYLVPFLGIITAWLGGKPVLFQEFGAPSLSPFDTEPGEEGHKSCQYELWPEDKTAAYYKQVLALVKTEGMLGAMAWCYSDYRRELWDKAPLNAAPHERYFGIVRRDNSAKPAARVWHETEPYVLSHIDSPSHLESKYPWLKRFNREGFYENPKNNLQQMFKLYRSMK